MSTEEKEKSLNFIEQIVADDIVSGKHGGRIHTRFPPEPNGYLHIGHAMAICLNTGIADQFNGKFNLRFDDTNPATEETEYVESIKKDVRWLGADWEDREFYTSDYFDQLYAFAIKLIKDGNAYIDESTSEEIVIQKGTADTPGTESPYRNRPIEENLDLFQKMKIGEIEEGAMVLRAKVDMTSPNMHMRDPIIYRVKKEPHHRTGDTWNIYPMYDFAHGQSDSIEKITHSLCTMEFEHHRPLYNWFIDKLDIFPSRQIEFARRNVSYMITSKRRLLRLVNDGVVSGWDDPRMPTIAGIRRRGFSPGSIRLLAEKSGIAKRDNIVDISLLEFCAREDLNKLSQRRMVVLDPLKVVITNYPVEGEELLSAQNNPEDETTGSRQLEFGNEIYIERSDFMVDPPRKFFRMGPGRDVRLKHAYILHCEGFDTDESGEVSTVYCTYYDNSKSGEDVSGVKAKGTLHWVNAKKAIDVEIRDYDRLFTVPDPLAQEEDFMEYVNADSLRVITGAKAEPSLESATTSDHFQFLRKGYFILDPDSADKKIFNLTVGLRDSWAKKNKK